MADQSRFAPRFLLHTLLILGLAPVLLTGCAGSVEAEKGLVPVKGRITLNGGPWPRSGQITFVPTKAGQGEGASVSSIAEFGTDGAFTVGHEGSNGLKPGTYWISVDCPEGETGMPLPGEKPVHKNAVPAKYRDPEKSGLSLSVEDGKPAEATFDVVSK